MTDTTTAAETATPTNTMDTSKLDLSDYAWPNVTNVDQDGGNANVNDSGCGRMFFNYGYQLLLAYQHELAAKYFADCIAEAPDCALAHALLAYCHGPNYNFKGEGYYKLSYDYGGIEDKEKGKDKDEDDGDDNENDESVDDEDPFVDPDPPFPSQIVADRHSLLAVQIVEKLKDKNSTPSNGSGGCDGNGNGDDGHGLKALSSSFAGLLQHEDVEASTKFDGSGSESKSQSVPISTAIQDLEVQIIQAIRILTCNPGMDPSVAEERKDVPFSRAMREVYNKYPRNPDVAFIFVASVMTIHAWKLFEYPTGRPLSSDITEIQTVMETSLEQFPDHVGLCHLYCHLCEMSSYPEKALMACNVLRTKFPDAGHLLHMPTHIDVLIGDYESCVRCNMAAIRADKKTMDLYPKYNNQTSFYFGYIVHDYHMLIYGAILGAMEGIAMEVAAELNEFVHEDLFREQPALTEYLESYAAMDIHIMFRFGRWGEILRLKFPKDSNLMLYRSASLYYARAVSYANLGDVDAAREEAKCFEKLRTNPTAKRNLLHNNIVSDLLEVDSAMMKGEIAYFEGKYELAFETLRKAVELQDGLNYDEPWGKMQPIRHALGGLLLQQGRVEEAEEVFRKDLIQHPKNPWAIVGLIECLNVQLSKTGDAPRISKCSSHCGDGDRDKDETNQLDIPTKIAERKELQAILNEQRKCHWADFDVMHSCACVR